jgi:predicted nucleotidyltransferase
MTLQHEIATKLLALKPLLLSQYYVDKIGYFGSFARNEQTINSDIDILISLKKPLGWAFFELQELLEKELSRKVDLVTVNSLKEQLRETILQEVKYV